MVGWGSFARRQEIIEIFMRLNERCASRRRFGEPLSLPSVIC